MIILHQYPGAFGLPSLSPFCIKVELFLKMAKLPYQVKVEVNPFRGPKGKMPFIEYQGVEIPDSSLILKYLIQKNHLEQFEISDPRALAFKTMIEESLYFILLYSRWVDDEGYKIIEDSFDSLFPPFLGRPALRLIRHNLRNQARAQGIGRHSREEVYQFGEEQILTLSKLLGNNDYFFENRFTVFDCTAYSFISTILKQPIGSPLKEALIRHKNLCDYVGRIDLISFGERPQE